MKDKLIKIIVILIVVVTFSILVEPLFVETLPSAKLPNVEVYDDACKVTAYLRGHDTAYFLDGGRWGETEVLKGGSARRYREFLAETEANLTKFERIAEVGYDGKVEVLCARKRLSIWRTAESVLSVDKCNNAVLKLIIRNDLCIYPPLTSVFYSSYAIKKYSNAFTDETIYETLKKLNEI